VALRKDKVQAQLREFVTGLLEEGEAERGGALAQTGPMPGLFGLLGMAFIKQYYVALTDRRVLFVRTSQFSGRPIRLDFEDPRDSARAAHETDGTFWSLADYAGSRSLRLRYHKLWRDEMNVVLHALGGAPK
jgi:hypothetical protein